MTDPADRHDVPKCPVCDTLMFPYEGSFLCLTALGQSFQDEDGAWRRADDSRHQPMRPEEESYLQAHGHPPESI